MHTSVKKHVFPKQKHVNLFSFLCVLTENMKHWLLAKLKFPTDETSMDNKPVGKQI